MNEIINFLKKDTIYFFVLTFISITLFWPKYSINSMAMILLVGVWLIRGDIIKITTIKQNRVVYVYLILYLVFLAGLFYSENTNGANKLLIRRIPFILFPLVCLTIPRFIERRTKMFKTIYIYAALAACLYCHLCIVEKWHQSGSHVIELFKSYEYSYTYITDYIDLHPTYFSYLLILGLIFIETKISAKTRLKDKILLSMIGGYFILFMIHITSKIGIIGLGVLFIFFVAKSLYNKNFKLTLALTSVIVISIFTASQFNFTVQRYKQAINIFIPQKGVVHSSGGFRLFSTRAFKEEFPKHPIYGVGLADGQKGLDAYYDRIGFPHMKGLDYHNQYLQILIEHGIIGLVVFISALIWPLAISIKRKNKEFFLFLIITMLFLLVENMFIRHKGVVSFTLFNALFLFITSNYTKPEAKIN